METTDPRQRLFSEMNRWLKEGNPLTVTYDNTGRTGKEKFVVVDSEDRKTSVAISYHEQENQNPDSYRIYWVDRDIKERGELLFIKDSNNPERSHVKIDTDDKIINLQWIKKVE